MLASCRRQRTWSIGLARPWPIAAGAAGCVGMASVVRANACAMGCRSAPGGDASPIAIVIVLWAFLRRLWPESYRAGLAWQTHWLSIACWCAHRQRRPKNNRGSAFAQQRVGDHAACRRAVHTFEKERMSVGCCPLRSEAPSLGAPLSVRLWCPEPQRRRSFTCCEACALSCAWAERRAWGGGGGIVLVPAGCEAYLAIRAHCCVRRLCGDPPQTGNGQRAASFHFCGGK